MKISEAQSTVAAHHVVAATPTGGDRAGSIDIPEPTAPPDRITTDDAASFRSTVANGVTMAATERSLRLQALTHAVRSGGYRPTASHLAEQILAQAELEAHLAQALS